jgi:hypothetical protein
MNESVTNIITAVLMILIFGIPFFYAIRKRKSWVKEKNNALSSLRSDERFTNAKAFDLLDIRNFILISESGFIALKFKNAKEPKIVHIKDVMGFEVITNGKSAASGALVGGILFGGVGAIIGGLSNSEKIKSIIFLLKTNDFANPNVEIPIADGLDIKKGTSFHQALEQKIRDLMSTLEIIEKKHKGIA